MQMTPITSGVNRLPLFFLAAAACCLFAPSDSLLGQDSDFPNPYYDETKWKVWLDDDSPVTNAGKEISLAGIEKKRILPKIVDGRPVLGVTKLGDEGFGILWDDIYVNQDQGHSGFEKDWPKENGDFELRKYFIRVRLPNVGLAVQDGKIVNRGPTDLKKVGANFTSQSTTHMGHHLTNSAIQVIAMEQEYYFANVLRSGPAHASFRDNNSGPSTDLFQALVPCFYNSFGNSKSEIHALKKMIIAGSFLNTELKRKIKRHGIYPATVLYIWKNSLPFDVPYAHQMRHRVAYFSKGNQPQKIADNLSPFNLAYHSYDENEHIKKMIRLAYSMKEAPPISIFSAVKNTGGKMIYAARTAALVHQNKEDVVVRFSTKDCYDIQKKELKFSCVQICGNPESEVKKLDDSTFEVKVPYDEKLPVGRTTFLLIANNGSHDSNPAALTIYKEDGSENQRPLISVVERIDVLPGESATVDVSATDPEGYKVDMVVVNESGGQATLANGKLEFTGAEKASVHPERLKVIALDPGSGASHNSKVITVQTRDIVPRIGGIAADQRKVAPFELNLSAENSVTRLQKPLSYQWLIDGQARSKESSFKTSIDTAGVHQIELQATAGTQTATGTEFIEIEADWQTVLENDLSSWKKLNSSIKIEESEKNGFRLIRENKDHPVTGITSNLELKLPIRLDASFKRVRAGRGAGVRLFDVLIGEPTDADSGDRLTLDTSIGQEVDGKWDYRFITTLLEYPAVFTKLRCYVTKDPHHEGKVRYSGYIRNGSGQHFFIFDNRPMPSAGRCEIIIGAGFTAYKEFKIASPR